MSSSKSAQPNRQARGTVESDAPTHPPASQKSIDLMIEQLREDTLEHILDIVDRVWKRKDLFVRWPQKIPPSNPKATRKKKGSFANAPAVKAFLLAGGKCLDPSQPNKRWSVHHIYDGKFPAFCGAKTVWAVSDGDYFTKAAGLVAIHPIAHALADEVPLFAWLLRREAFKRFKFDPDGVFGG